MGKFKTISIYVKNNKEVYRAGEEVSGNWTVEATEDTNLKSGIICHLHGKAYVKWEEASSGRSGFDKFIGHEVFTNQQVTVFAKNVLQAGTHKFPFKFVFPTDKMPSSYEGSTGSVRYWLDIVIGRPFPWPDVERYKNLTFLDHVEVNYKMYSNPSSGTACKHLSKLLGVGDAGEVKLIAKINRTSFCPGEKVAISAQATNNSTKDLGTLKARLIQSVRYKANGKSKSVTTCVNALSGDHCLLPNKVLTWKDQLLNIDAIPPSTRMRASHCLVVSYHVKVLVDIPVLKGGDLTVTFPVIIGTVPQGHKFSKAIIGSGGGSCFADSSNVIPTTKCTRGWSNFNESTDDNMPVATYTPMCAYVRNYRYVPPAASQNHTVVKSSAPEPPAQRALTIVKPIISGASTSSQTPGAPVPASRTVPMAAAAPVPPLAYTPPQPSAPPALFGEEAYDVYGANFTPQNVVSPPSYDEIFGASSGEQETVSQDEDQVDNGYIMLIRFLKTAKEEFKTYIKENKGSLSKFQGQLSALEDSVVAPKEAKTEATALAVLSFPSKEMACDWLKLSSSLSTQSWYGSCDIIIFKAVGSFQETHTILCVQVNKRTSGWNAEIYSKMTQMAESYFKPARTAAGGVLLSNSKSNQESLRGKWDVARDDIIVNVSCWPNTASLTTYKKEIPKEILQQYDELKRKALERISYILIKLENLSHVFQTEEE